ncbi:hypothetical protein VH565_15895, partial [Sphingobium sp. 11R-BB]
VTPAGLRPTSMTPRRQQLEQPNRRRSTYQTSKAVQTNRATSEKAFSKLKAMLRKAEERTVSSLWDLIGKLVGIFQPTECANYFSSCGYDPE